MKNLYFIGFAHDTRIRYNSGRTCNFSPVGALAELALYQVDQGPLCTVEQQLGATEMHIQFRHPDEAFRATVGKSGGSPAIGSSPTVVTKASFFLHLTQTFDPSAQNVEVTVGLTPNLVDSRCLYE